MLLSWHTIPASVKASSKADTWHLVQGRAGVRDGCSARAPAGPGPPAGSAAGWSIAEGLMKLKRGAYCVNIASGVSVWAVAP